MGSTKAKGALTKTAIAALRANKKQIIPVLMLKCNKSVTSIERWIRNNNDYLTQQKCLEVICKELGMTQKEVLA